MNNDLNIDVRVYPIDEPQGSTLAFASVTFLAGETPVNAINGIRLVDDDGGAFVSMPQVKDGKGEFRDVAFPAMKGLPGSISKAIFEEYDKTVDSTDPEYSKKPHIYLGGRLPEGAGEITVEANMNAIKNPVGNTLAVGSVTYKIDDTPFAVTNNVRVVNGDGGLFVAMPQSERVNKEYGMKEYRDVAFPVKKGLRAEISDAAIESFEHSLAARAAEKGRRFNGRLAAGKEKVVEYKQNAASRPAKVAAKREGGGLGD